MKVNNPSGVFFRAYLLVALLVLTTGLILEKLLESQVDGTRQQHETQIIHGSFLYAQTLALPIDSRALLSEQKNISDALQLPATLHALTDFSSLDEQYATLTSGSIVVMFDNDDNAIFYRRMNNTDWVLALAPPPELKSDRSQWIVPLFYSLIALAVFLWIRPLSRDLEIMRQSAFAFGRQDFSTRTNITASSWLAPLGNAFNSMAERIQVLLRSHSDLTHAVSHELRTPLARLRFSLEMLRSDNGTGLIRHCDSMNEDVAELNQLIEEMLSYAQLNQDNLTAKHIPLAIGPWISDYVEGYKLGDSTIELTLHQSSELRSLIDNSDTVEVDAHLLNRALDNLVGNALRFASNRVEITVQLSNTDCEIHVQDDGPGIPEHKREAALRAYTRLEPGNGQGFGLGLAIVKRIMDLHGGEIVLANTPGKGADISLRWPLRVADNEKMENHL